MRKNRTDILKELRKTEAMVAGALERCCKIRELIEEEVSTSPDSQRLKGIGAAAVAKRRARKNR